MADQLSKDIEYCDAFIDVSTTEKRIIRASIKTYKTTGTYVSLKLFRKEDNEFKFSQKITLSLNEFEKLSSQTKQVKNLVVAKEEKKKPNVIEKKAKSVDTEACTKTATDLESEDEQ